MLHPSLLSNSIASDASDAMPVPVTDSTATSDGRSRLQDLVPSLLSEMNSAQDEVNRWQRKQQRLLKEYRSRVQALPADLDIALADEQLAFKVVQDSMAASQRRYQDALWELEALSERIQGLTSAASGHQLHLPGQCQTAGDKATTVRWRRVVLGRGLELMPTHPDVPSRSKDALRLKREAWHLAGTVLLHSTLVTVGFIIAARRNFQGAHNQDPTEDHPHLASVLQALIEHCIYSTLLVGFLAWYLKSLFGQHRQHCEITGIDFQPLHALYAAYADMLCAFLFYALAAPGFPLLIVLFTWLRVATDAYGKYCMIVTLSNRILLMEHSCRSGEFGAWRLRRCAKTIFTAFAFLQLVQCLILYIEAQFAETSLLRTSAILIQFGQFLLLPMDMLIWVHAICIIRRACGTVLSGLRACNWNHEQRSTVLTRMRLNQGAMLAACAFALSGSIAKLTEVVLFQAKVVNTDINLKGVVGESRLQFLGVGCEFVTLMLLSNVFDTLEIHFTDFEVDALLHNLDALGMSGMLDPEAPKECNEVDGGTAEFEFKQANTSVAFGVSCSRHAIFLAAGTLARSSLLGDAPLSPAAKLPHVSRRWLDAESSVAKT